MTNPGCKVRVFYCLESNEAQRSSYKFKFNLLVLCAQSRHYVFDMEKLTSIVKGTTAKLSHVCGGRVFYQIQTPSHLYQLEIDSSQKEWETTYLFPEFKAITLMRWIRKGMEQNDGSFIKLS